MAPPTAAFHFQSLFGARFYWKPVKVVDEFHIIKCEDRTINLEVMDALSFIDATVRHVKN